MAIVERRPLTRAGRPYEGSRIPQPIPTVLEVDPNLEDVLRVNFGPNHPSTHGVLRLIVDLHGEHVVGISAVIGYLHTGFEKTMEQKTWWKGVTYPARVDYVSFQYNELVFVLAVEKLLPGPDGRRLAARIDRPDGEPRAWALYAHCFTCGKDGLAASRIARTLDRAGDAQAAAVAALRASPVAVEEAEAGENRSLELLREARALAEEQQQQVEQRELLRQREGLLAAYRQLAERQVAVRTETEKLVSDEPLDRRQLGRNCRNYHCFGRSRARVRSAGRVNRKDDR